MDDSPDSVTQWLRLVEQGEDSAAAELWQRYSQRLTALAKVRLRGTNDPWADEEDIAVCVFASLLQRIQSGEAKQIENRDHLWRLLAWATRHRTADHFRRENTQKRNPRITRNAFEQSLSGQDGCEQKVDGSKTERVPIHQVLFHTGDLDRNLLDQRLPAELMVDFLDELKFLESKLPAEELREIARLKLEGWKNLEIAAHMQKSLSSIERKLRIIREVWLKEFSS